MTSIDLYNRDNTRLATVHLTPTGGEAPALVVWKGQFFVRRAERCYVETFAWPAFTMAELEEAGLQGLIT